GLGQGHVEPDGGCRVEDDCRARARRPQPMSSHPMASPSNRPAKIFTVEQANAALPLVRAITADLVRLSREVVERRERLTLLAAPRNAAHQDPYAEELAQI